MECYRDFEHSSGDVNFRCFLSKKSRTLRTWDLEKQTWWGRTEGQIGRIFKIRRPKAPEISHGFAFEAMLPTLPGTAGSCFGPLGWGECWSQNWTLKHFEIAEGWITCKQFWAGDVFPASRFATQDPNPCSSDILMCVCVNTFYGF